MVKSRERCSSKTPAVPTGLLGFCRSGPLGPAVRTAPAKLASDPGQRHLAYLRFRRCRETTAKDEPARLVVGAHGLNESGLASQADAPEHVSHRKRSRSSFIEAGHDAVGRVSTKRQGRRAAHAQVAGDALGGLYGIARTEDVGELRARE